MKKNKLKISYLFVIVIVFVIYFVPIYSVVKFFMGFTVRSTDHRNDEQIVIYLKSYMKEKYDADVTLELGEKELLKLCKWDIDGCAVPINNEDVFSYFFYGTDNNGKQFNIMYFNSFRIGLEKIPLRIEENYHFYKDKEEIGKIIERYSNTYDIYQNMQTDFDFKNEGSIRLSNTFVFTIYMDRFDVLRINELKEAIKEYDKDHNKIIVTNHKDFYDQKIKEVAGEKIRLNQRFNRVQKFVDNRSNREVPFNELTDLNLNYPYYVTFYFFGDETYKLFRIID